MLLRSVARALNDTLDRYAVEILLGVSGRLKRSPVAVVLLFEAVILLGDTLEGSSAALEPAM